MTSRSDKKAQTLDAPAQRLIDAYDRRIAEIKQAQEAILNRLPAAGYSVPMILECAEAAANNEVDKLTPWGAATFSAIFRNATEAARAALERHKGDDFAPFFAVSAALDPEAHGYFLATGALTGAINERTGIANGYLRVAEEDDGFCLVALAASRRRSALTLLRTKAQFMAASPKLKAILANPTKSIVIDNDFEPQMVDLLRHGDLAEINPLRRGLPKTWSKLLQGLEITEQGLLAFLAFASALRTMPSRWFRKAHLLELFPSFCEEYEFPKVAEAEFEKLLELFSTDLPTAERVGVVIPFHRIGDWYRLWFFAFHVLLPELVFVAAVQAKHDDLWSRTFGSDMAGVANYLKSELPDIEGVLVETCRRKKGVGDVDLAIFDTRTNELLICEIKTVFDRFRTDFQASNFTEQKVKFDHAIEQLDRAAEEISAGNWSMSDLLGRRGLRAPSKIHRLVLLWREQTNPTLDAGSFVPVVDFATFARLFSDMDGSPSRVVTTIEHLAKLFWVTVFEGRQDDPDLGTVKRELEMPALPPLSHLKTLGLPADSLEIAQELSHLPESWHEQGLEISFPEPIA
ncbi:hypothetical protein [uncultured Brevundimonas sp.]|uniref:hypothetical protein n=1 Tax=uncultured Brevundimonas sp. TaxID=213418 RepID=UPI0025F8D947|nr:hypothetical protein [uncultured Brevundimonas sp.]